MAFISRLLACVGVLLLLPVLDAPGVDAQDEAAPEVVIFVLDLSGSMNEPFDDDQTKLEAAKAAFVQAFADVSPDALVGLRTYGDQIAPTSPEGRQESCTTDTRLVTPVGPLQRDALIEDVQGFSALGDTPMGLALQAASTDIPEGARGTIVLFSDGRDECFDADLDGDPAAGPSFGEEPCQIAKSLLGGSSRVDRVVTVGFATDAAAASELRCIADATAGAYTAIETAADARDVLPDLLVELSAPREAERLDGRTIAGTEDTETAPDLLDLGAARATQILYTDTIEVNSERIYRVPEFRPGGGTLTATVFGLPPEPGLTFDLRMYSPGLDREFFEGDYGDTDAGLPERSSASIRCTGCALGDRASEVFWIISLTSEERGAKGTYELELLTEGPGFGGPETSCRAPQACYYGAEIEAARAEVAVLEAEISSATDERASESLIARRDAIQAEADAAQAAVDTTNLRIDDLEARIASAPQRTTSWRLPLIMIVLGAILAFAPLNKLRRSRDDEDHEQADAHPSDSEVSLGTEAAANAADTGAIALGGGRGQSNVPHDVGEAPAESENRPGAHDWDAELEAAKAALAQQRPVHPREEQAADPLPQRTPSAETIAAQKAAVAATALAEPPSDTTETSNLPIALESATPVVAAVQPASESAGSAALALPASTSPVTQQPAAAQQQAATQQAAAQQAAAAQQQAAAVQQPAAAQQAESGGQAAGWYPDPAGKSTYRWWDGATWTEHTNSGEGAE